MEIKLDVYREIECDVLVIGGGVSGISAAICAAREGVKVILAEANGCLGGTATSGLVGPFMTCSDAKGEKQIIKGIYKEFVDSMESLNGAIQPMKCEAGTSYSGYYTKGHKNCGPFSAETLKLVAEEKCISSRVNILYTLTLIHIIKNGNKIEKAVFASKSKIYTIKAKRYIDCTGDANAAYLAGAEFNMESADKLQATSLFFEIDGIDKSEYDKYCSSKKDVKGDDHFDKVIAEERALGRYCSERPRLGTYESCDGSWRVNGTRICNIDGTDAEDVTRAIIAGRRQMMDIVDMLKRRIPGCENVYLKSSASMLGVRESRRIVGEYVLSAEDLANGKVFDDAIVKCSNSIDYHSNTNGSYVESSTDCYTIPYRSLLPKEIDNLIVAGRCVSADKLALSAIRVMPPCFAMGQAAGTAAAISVKDSCGLKTVDINKLKETLKENGVYL